MNALISFYFCCFSLIFPWPTVRPENVLKHSSTSSFVMSLQLSNSSMNVSVANVWSWFVVFNLHEFTAITTVYGGPIGGMYGGPIGGFNGVYVRFAMFLYNIIVIRTWFLLALIFFLSFIFFYLQSLCWRLSYESVV